MATESTPQVFNQSAIVYKSLVNMSYRRIGSGSRPGGMDTQISDAPTSIPPALWLITGMSSLTRIGFCFFLPFVIRSPRVIAMCFGPGGTMKKSPERGLRLTNESASSSGTMLRDGHPAPSYLRPELPGAHRLFFANIVLQETL